MKRILTTSALVLALAIPAHAGGPVIEEEPLVAGDYDEKRGVNPLLILGGLLLIGALVSGGGDDPAPVTPEPQPEPEPKPCVYEGGGGC